MKGIFLIFQEATPPSLERDNGIHVAPGGQPLDKVNLKKEEGYAIIYFSSEAQRLT